MNAIELRGVVKRYGRVLALDGLALEVPRGAVSALIGPNGSGKTTTFGVLAGLLRVDAGEVVLFGEGPFDPTRHAGRVSLMPQDSAPSPYSSIKDILSYYAELGGQSGAQARRDADHWLARVGLEKNAGARIGELSHGMRRRFSIAQALLGRPELILLDEPTSGLDPEVAVQIRELVREQRGQATLLISSHVLSELEALCDHAVILHAGRAIRQGSMQAITGADTRVRVTLTRPPDLEALGSRLERTSLSWQAPELVAQSSGGESVEALNARLLAALLAQGAGILELSAGDSLEATYLATRAAARRQS
jgi:ABC-type multidrug transport system ATPase subunit